MILTSCKLSRIHFKRGLIKAFRRCLVKIYSARPIKTSIDNLRKPRRGLPTSDLQLPTSDFQLPTSDFRLPTSVAMKGGDRPTRLLPYAKMLLVPKTFFSLLWVDYAPEGSGYAANFTLRGHGTHIDLLWFLFLVSLRSWRYCVIKVLAAEPRSKKREWGRGVWNNFSRLRRSWRLRRQLSLDWYSGSAAKSLSPSTRYRQLCRLVSGRQGLPSDAGAYSLKLFITAE